MHTLKDTLGRQQEKEEPSLKYGKINNNKSKAKWALDEDELADPPVNSKNEQFLEQTILAAYQKDSTFSEMVFFEVNQNIQAYYSSQMQALTSLQKAIGTLLPSAEESMQKYLEDFKECTLRHMKKLKKREKKEELHEFDKIVQTNFKRKGAAFIDEENPIQILKNRQKMLGICTNERQQSSNRHNGSSGSSDGRLSLLLSKDSIKKPKQEKKEEKDVGHEESVSFSSILSHQNMTVRQRQRQPRKQKPQKKLDEQKGEKDSKEGNDEAFVFYRPKNRRKG